MAANQIVTVDRGNAETNLAVNMANNGVINLGAPTGAGYSLLRGPAAVTLNNNGQLNTVQGDGGPRYLRVNLTNGPSGTVNIASADTRSDSGEGATTTTNNGTFVLQSAGVYRVSGGSVFVPGTTGTMEFHLAGEFAFGQLRADNAVNVDGTADPVLENDFDPSPGTRFPVIVAGHAGSFSDVLNGFTGGAPSPSEPRKGASPKANTPPSAATSQ